MQHAVVNEYNMKETHATLLLCLLHEEDLSERFRNVEGHLVSWVAMVIPVRKNIVEKIYERT